jgi:hypothetical protein
VPSFQCGFLFSQPTSSASWAFAFWAFAFWAFALFCLFPGLLLLLLLRLLPLLPG